VNGAIALAVGAAFTGLALAAAPDGSLRPLARELAAASEPLGKGRNVVNVILVDFRALDTLAEIVVLSIAALGIAALARRAGSRTALAPKLPASPILRSATRLLVPLLGLLSVFLFARGHNEPGGGFVAGLVAAAAMMLHAFAFPVNAARTRRSCERIAFAGVAVALLAGFLGLLLRGSFLEGLWLDAPVPTFGKLGTPVLFDAGVFLVVVGVVTGALFDLRQSEGA
jgi:multicomponent Na+:H+ antiporter subunit A